MKFILSGNEIETWEEVHGPSLGVNIIEVARVIFTRKKREGIFVKTRPKKDEGLDI